MLDSTGQSLFFSRHLNLKFHSHSQLPFSPEGRLFCCPRTSQGGSGGGHSHGLVLYSYLLNVKEEEFPDPVVQRFPASKVCLSDTVTEMTEKLNALYVQGQVLGTGTERCPRRDLCSWWMRRSQRGDRMGKQIFVQDKRCARVKVVTRCWGHAAEAELCIKGGISSRPCLWEEETPRQGEPREQGKAMDKWWASLCESSEKWEIRQSANWGQIREDLECRAKEFGFFSVHIGALLKGV